MRNIVYNTPSNPEWRETIIGGESRIRDLLDDGWYSVTVRDTYDSEPVTYRFEGDEYVVVLSKLDLWRIPFDLQDRFVLNES